MKKKSVIAHLKLMRFDHWIKNLFMLPGVAIAISFNSITKNEILDNSILRSVALVFFSLCLASSANYTINEWLDRDFDRIHPFKKHRIASSFRFSAKVVYLQYFSLLLVIAILSMFMEMPTRIFLAILLIMGILYNVEPIRLKDRYYLDVISESINNPIRLALGWYAVSPNVPVPASAYLSFWGMGIFLMSLKRYAEMVIISDPAVLNQYRKSFSKWAPEKLLTFAFLGGLTSCSFLGIMLIRYRIEYVIVLPVLIWIFVEYLKISLALDPASYAPEKLMKKTRLQILSIFFALLFVGLTFVDITILNEIIGSKSG